MTKKELEKNQVEKFLLIANIKYRELYTLQNEPPDLILTSNDGRRIGIKHTMLTIENGTIIKEKYSAFDKVVAQAQKIYESIEQPPVNVYVDFKEPVDTRNKKDKILSMELCELVIKHIPSFYEKTYAELIVPSDLLPYYTYRIKISRHVKHNRNLWQRVSGFWSGEITNDLLSNAIDKKNSILLKTAYYKNFDETWLVLISEGKEWSEFATYKPQNFIIQNHWKFDKIFVCAMFGEEYEQIK